MLRQLFTRPTKRAIQAGGAVLLAGAMVCGSVPAYATGHLKPHEVTPIVQPDEPVTTAQNMSIIGKMASWGVALSLVGHSVLV